jgi:hypothetical protein
MPPPVHFRATLANFDLFLNRKAILGIAADTIKDQLREEHFGTT